MNVEADRTWYLARMPEQLEAFDEVGVQIKARMLAYRIGFEQGRRDAHRHFGTFENIATTEHILARSGRNLPDLEITIQSVGIYPGCSDEDRQAMDTLLRGGATRGSSIDTTPFGLPMIAVDTHRRT